MGPARSAPAKRGSESEISTFGGRPPPDGNVGSCVDQAGRWIPVAQGGFTIKGPKGRRQKSNPSNNFHRRAYNKREERPLAVVIESVSWRGKRLALLCEGDEHYHLPFSV